MRINFVLPYAGLQGGIKVIAIYCQQLLARGHVVNVVSMPPEFTWRSRLKGLLYEGRLPHRPRREPSHLDLMGIGHAVLDVNRDVQDADLPDADVVVATYYTTAPGVMRLSPAKGAKAIFIQNYEVQDGRPNLRLDESWRMPMHKITISRWLVDLAATRFGDNCVSHVPNSVDMHQFHAPARDKGATPTVGLLYNTFSLKGLDTSLRALARIRASIPELRVISFGAERPDFRQPLPRGTEFHHQPAQHLIRELYARCDVWMCGSNVEGFHLPPLEAMACRCPVVSTAVGGPLDIIEEGVNGHLVAVRDADALADRTMAVLRLTPEAWKRMSDAALLTAQRYSWDDATTLFEKALQRSINKAQTRHATQA